MFSINSGKLLSGQISTAANRKDPWDSIQSLIKNIKSSYLKNKIKLQHFLLLLHPQELLSCYGCNLDYTETLFPCKSTLCLGSITSLPGFCHMFSKISFIHSAFPWEFKLYCLVYNFLSFTFYLIWNTDIVLSFPFPRQQSYISL